MILIYQRNDLFIKTNKIHYFEIQQYINHQMQRSVQARKPLRHQQ